MRRKSVKRVLTFHWPMVLLGFRWKASSSKYLGIRGIIPSPDQRAKLLTAVAEEAVIPVAVLPRLEWRIDGVPLNLEKTTFLFYGQESYFRRERLLALVPDGPHAIGRLMDIAENHPRFCPRRGRIDEINL